MEFSMNVYWKIKKVDKNKNVKKRKNVEEIKNLKTFLHLWSEASLTMFVQDAVAISLYYSSVSQTGYSSD